MNNLNNQINLTREQIDEVMALYKSNQFNEAILRIKELNEQYPNVPLLFNILGACYKAIDEIDGALQMFEIATKIKPDYAEAYFNLALMQQDNDLVSDAILSYKKTIEINPNYSAANNNLGILYLNKKNLTEAIKHFKFAIDSIPNFAEAHNNLGSAFQEMNQMSKAIRSYKKAIDLKPNYAQAQVNLGISLQKIGKNNAAKASYEDALESQPNYIAAHHNLSQIKKYTENDPQVDYMRSLISNNDLNIIDKSRLCFSLAKAYEDLNRIDEFFEFLSEGNKLRKEYLNFSYENSEVNYNPFIKNLFKKTFKNIDEISNCNIEKSPIFILGMPRSGTTLVEQIISNHPKVYGGGELHNLTEILIPLLQKCIQNTDYNLNESDIISVRNEYLEKLSLFDFDEQVFTDKWPLNFRHIGFILSAFPEAKIIHLRRDAKATCWSIYRHYFADNANGWAYDFSDLFKFYDAYEDLMKYWHQLYPKKIYDLSYEKLTKNQEKETHQLLDFCSLEWDENCLNFHRNKGAVGTASVTQVRKKMYQGSSDSWKKYKEYLKPLTNHFGVN